MSEIIEVTIGSIDPNPFRLLGEYPFVERKLDALQRSIKDVGLWEGIIARRNGNRNEIAFGHHRIEAAKRSGLKKILIIQRYLSDEQMLQFLGRENLEDYNADFLVMLETWEAALKFKTPVKTGKVPKPIEIARLLGWTRPRGERDNDTLSNVADACHAAHNMITGGHIARSDLRDLTVTSAKIIVERTQSRIQLFEDAGKAARWERKDIDTAKRIVGTAAKKTAEKVREGSVAHKDIRETVDREAYRAAGAEKDDSKAFPIFARELSQNLFKVLNEDTYAEKLEQIVEALPHLQTEAGEQAIDGIVFELERLDQRSDNWKKKLRGKPIKLIQTPLRAIEGGQ